MTAKDLVQVEGLAQPVLLTEYVTVVVPPQTEGAVGLTGLKEETGLTPPLLENFDNQVLKALVAAV